MNVAEPRQVSLWQYLRTLPKVDLHVHLTGCARVATIAELVNERRVLLDIPSGVRLDDCLTFRSPAATYAASFAPWREVLNHVTHLPGVLARLVVELAEDLAADGVRYAEVRVSPRMIFADGRLDQTLQELSTARQIAFETFNCDLRWVLGFTREYFSALDDQSQLKVAEVFLRAAEPYRHTDVVGFDLWGNESAAPPRTFARVFALIREAGYKLTIHAGEVAPPSDVREAVELLGATRVGHAVTAASDNEVLAFLRDQGTVVETCLTSNWITGSTLDIPTHPLRRMLAEGIDVALATDNRTTHRTSLTTEFVRSLFYGLVKPADLGSMLVLPSRFAFCDEESRASLTSSMLRDIDVDQLAGTVQRLLDDASRSAATRARVRT